MQSLLSKALVVTGSLVFLVACASTPKAAQTSAPARLTDAQIAAIVVTANQIDVENGELAIARSENPEVQEFAERMIADHKSVNQAAVELVTRLQVTPEETDTSRGLARSAAATRQNLASLSGAAFDKAYVDNEVAYHEAVIGLLDSTLIPNAANEELKSTLVGVRPAFVAHLEHARSIQKALQGHASVDHAH